MMLGLFASEVRRDFRDMVLSEVEAMYGVDARADAEEAGSDPARIDVVGVALRSGVPLVPSSGNARATAKWWARENGYEPVMRA
ncbi:hypothetical protein [Halomarina oriensis]|uniref:Uncharacterized protein n=1 Tax=Halomarina oriensis TaxID=671145 RepID=A0A6B0GNF9_9EURY|nr:hypothetical protein [Halomarina oriensis]MWG33118.1 hypothetical protein [Halomarina oriensis]